MKIFANFWKYLNKNTKLSFFLIIFFSLIQSVLEMLGIAAVIPFVTFLLNPDALKNIEIISNYIDIESISKNENIIYIFCVILFLIFFFKNMIIIFTNKLTYKFVYSFRSNMYKNLLNKILHQDYLFFVQKGMGKIFHQTFLEVENFSANIVRPIIILVIEIFISFAIIILVIYTGYANGIIYIIPVFILAALILKKINRSIKLWSNERIASNEKIFNLNFNLIHGIKEIFILGKIKKILDNINIPLENLKNIDSKNAVVATLPKAILEQFIILVLIMIILSMRFVGSASEEIIITLTFYVAVAYRLVPSFNKIFTSYQQIKYGKPSLPIINEYSNLKKQNIFFDDANYEEINDDKIITFKDNVEFKNISFSYDGKNKIIKDLNFKINKNDLIGIYGQSGSGKSTFVNLLTRLIKPSSGQIFIDDIEVENLNDARKYQNFFNITSQDTFLLNGTIKDNIVFGSQSKISTKTLEDAIKFARLEEMLDELPNGIETDTGLTFKKLSSGQKQRITIARSIYLDREILIFDEATNALDEENEKIIIENICKLKLKKTIIIISHNLENLSKCDVIYSLEKGKLIKN